MKKILISTGGSGGHVIPSLTIYDILKENFQVHIVTDLRGSRYIKNHDYSLIDVPNIFTNLFFLPYNFIKFCISIFKSYKYLKSNNFDILISTGGYMSLPLCIASNLLRLEIFVFEPNSVIGQVNKLTLVFAKKIICYHKNIRKVSDKFSKKIYSIDPLLRKEIYNYKKNEKKMLKEQKKILIIGGSQGAKFFDNFISKIIVELSKTQKIKVLQQVVDQKSRENLRLMYEKNHIEHELFDFDDKLLSKANNCDLAISRGGASAMSELSYLNIPFVAIPFPYAKDNHQYYNADFYKKNECCWLIMQKDINENNFKALLENIFNDSNEYFSKKKNLSQLYKNNTWEKNKARITEIINEN